MKTDQPEIQWLKAYRRGDAAALGKLVEHFRRPLFAYIYNMLQGRGDAEEIFQETWLRVIRNTEKFRTGNFAGWLFRIAHNLYVDQVRKQAHPAHPRLLPGTDDDRVPAIERQPSADPPPDRAAADSDLGARILAAVSELPDDQREVFMMRTEGGIPFREIARIQNTNINTVLARMQYAMKRMRPLLQEDYDSLGRG